MFSRAWIAGIALGLAFGGSPLCVQAQVGESDEQRQSGPEQNPPQDPRWRIPVEIIEDEAETDSRKRRDERAEQRELDDLAAQQGMDESTEKMADFAVYQTILIAIGTVALIYTLYLTRQANRAAVEAVKVTREIGQAQTRAYLGVELRGGILMDTVHHTRPQLFGGLDNTGNSPASDVVVSISVEFTTLPDNSKIFSVNGEKRIPHVLSQSHDSNVYFELESFNFDDGHREMIRRQEMRMTVLVSMVYTDVFDTPITTKPVTYWGAPQVHETRDSRIECSLGRRL